MTCSLARTVKHRGRRRHQHRLCHAASFYSTAHHTTLVLLIIISSLGQLVSPTVLLLVADDAHTVSATATDDTSHPIHPSLQQLHQQQDLQLQHINLTEHRNYSGRIRPNTAAPSASTALKQQIDERNGFLFSFTHVHPNIDLIIRVHMEDKHVQYITLLLSFQENNTVPSFHQYDRRFTHYFAGYVRNKRFDVTAQELRPYFEHKYAKELAELRKSEALQSSRSRECNADPSNLDCTSSTSTASAPSSVPAAISNEIPMSLNIYIRLLIDSVPFPTQQSTDNSGTPPTSNAATAAGTYTISIQYNFSVTEGLLLFIGYALFVILCFLVIPCCCVLTVISASCIKRRVFRLCGVRRANASASSTISLQNNNNQQHSSYSQTTYILQDTYEELLSIFQQLDQVTDSATNAINGAIPSRVTKSNLKELTSEWTMSQSLLQDAKYMSNTLNQTCSICLEDFAEHDQIRMLVSCKHIFHQPCIDKWLFSGGDCNIKQVCPICKCPI